MLRLLATSFRTHRQIREIEISDCLLLTLVCYGRWLRSKDARVKYFEAAYSAPEELLEDLCVTVGILGLPRSEMDAMLSPLKTQEQRPPSSSDAERPASPALSRHSSKDLDIPEGEQEVRGMRVACSFLIF